MGREMKLIMFVEPAGGSTTFRILNRKCPRTKHPQQFDKTFPIRIYWFWEDSQKYGSNFKSVMRRMGVFGYIQQEEIYTI